MTGPGIATPISKQLLREARVARALREVAGALGASLELDELLELVLRKLTELLCADRAILFLLDERQRELVSRSATSEDAHPLRISLGEGLLGHVARTGRLQRVDDFRRSTRRAEWDPLLEYESKNAVAVPLKNNLSRTIGVILAVNKKDSVAFDADDEEILSVLAKQAAIAIDNSRLLVTLIRRNQQLQQAQVQLTRRVRDLELLFELERHTAQARSHEELARLVLESLARACGATGAVLVLTEDDDDGFVEFSLNLQERRGEAGGSVFQSSVYSPSEGVLGPVIQEARPIQMDAATEPLSLPGLPAVASMIAEPLEGEATPLGALALMNKQGGPFTAEDLGLLRLVSANVSTAVRLFNSNRQREQQERLSSIGRLLSQVVHDLKSPLTVISGYVQLMEESSKRAQRAHYAQEILKQFDALGAMQREVLAFARGETRVFARRVIVDRFFADLREQLETELEGRGIELEMSTTPRLVAHFDSERLTRALQNLVRNAAEAMGEAGGTIRISAKEDANTLTLRVSDTGPGIPPSIAPRLFRSFVTSGKDDGTGLGLAIVKRIVEEHGGTIQLCDVPRGACFVIRLPHRVEEESSKEALAEQRSIGGELPAKKGSPGRGAQAGARLRTANPRRKSKPDPKSAVSSRRVSGQEQKRAATGPSPRSKPAASKPATSKPATSKPAASKSGASAAAKRGAPGGSRRGGAAGSANKRTAKTRKRQAKR